MKATQAAEIASKVKPKTYHQQAVEALVDHVCNRIPTYALAGEWEYECDLKDVRAFGNPVSADMIHELAAEMEKLGYRRVMSETEHEIKFSWKHLMPLDRSKLWKVPALSVMEQ